MQYTAMFAIMLVTGSGFNPEDRQMITPNCVSIYAELRVILRLQTCSISYDLGATIVIMMI